MKGEIYDRIRQFWDQNPCGTTHVSQPLGTREYFIEIDRYFDGMYPYLTGFLDEDAMHGKQVLEVGLGSGYTLHKIAARASECYAVDLSLETVKLNQARARYFGLRVQFVHASVTELPFNDNSIDIVVSIGCLHHVPAIEHAVGEIHRVLKPGGIFKGMVYNRNSYRYRVSIPLAILFLPRWRGKTRLQCVNEVYDGKGNPYGVVYSKRQLSKLLSRFRRLEFRTENFVGHDLIPRIGSYVPRKVWLSTLGKMAGLDLYFTAIKP